MWKCKECGEEVRMHMFFTARGYATVSKDGGHDQIIEEDIDVEDVSFDYYCCADCGIEEEWNIKNIAKWED